MNNDELKKMIEETIGSNDPYWNEPVFQVIKKIIDLPENAETTIARLLESDNKLDTKFMFEITKLVNVICKKINITLDYSKNDGKDLGLPFHISFIKKTL